MFDAFPDGGLVLRDTCRISGPRAELVDADAGAAGCGALLLVGGSVRIRLFSLWYVDEVEFAGDILAEAAGGTGGGAATSFPLG